MRPVVSPFIPPRPFVPADFGCSLPTALARPSLPGAVLRTCADLCGVTPTALVSARRTPDLVKARQIAMWLIRHRSALAYTGIARLIGDRDHATIIHGCRRVDAVIGWHGIVEADGIASMARRLWSADWQAVPR